MLALPPLVSLALSRCRRPTRHHCALVWHGLGNPAALNGTLSMHPGPRYVSRLWAQVNHGPVLRRCFFLLRDSPYQVSARTDGGRNPDLGPDDNPARRLTSADIGEINRLRRAAGSFGILRGKLIDRSPWYGVFEDGHLVALYGGDILYPTYGVRVGGRTMVHPKYRGRRYADLPEYANRRNQSDDNVYSVRVNTMDPLNSTVVQRRRRREAEGKSSKRLAMEVLATSAYRRDPVGLASLIRRVLARRRAPKSA